MAKKKKPSQSDRIVQRHIRAILGIEESQAAIMVRIYREAAQNLRTRLLDTTDNSFTEARIQTTLAQLDLAIAALEREITIVAREGQEMSHDQGVEDTVTEINHFEEEFAGVVTEIPVNVILASTRPRNMLFNQYLSSILSYHQELRANVQRSLTQAVVQGKTLSQVAFEVQMIINSQTWKAQRITRTELHNIYNVSKLDSMGNVKEKFVPDLQKMLVHPMDKRTGADSKALAEMNPVVDINKPFRFTWNGEERVFMNPPDRPNDRAIMIPVRKSYFD